MTRQYVAAAALFLTACMDVSGPRERPGTPRDSVNNPQQSGLIWYTLEPRVISLGRTESVRVTARISGNATASVITRSSEQYPLSFDGRDYTVSVPVSALLGDLRPGELHTVGAQLTLSGVIARTDISFNIRDAALPSVTVRAIAPGVQASDRILNLRLDTTSIGTTLLPTVMREVYRHLFDNFDFVAVVEAVRSARNTSYQRVSNDVTGIGLTLFDSTAQFGSAGRLQGILQFPSDDLYDLATTSSLRVLGERWMNYTHVSMLSSGRPFWPLSSLAYGVMALGSGTRSIPFPYRLTPIANGYRLDPTEPPTEFNDFELYLMGLLAPEQVRAGFVFRDQGQISVVSNGALLNNPIDSVRVTDIVAVEGARNPAFSGTAPTFRIATIVLSRGRLLTHDELSFYDHLAARGEAEAVLPYTVGTQRGQTRPFFLATGQRARLNPRLANPPALKPSAPLRCLDCSAR